MLNISQKKELVQRLVKEISDSQILIIIDYKGLNVSKMTDLRSRLRKEEVTIEVVKNSLLERACDKTSLALLKDFFDGANALVLSKDPVAPAKVLVEFAKNNEKLEIKAGILSEKLLSVDEIKQLAKMLSREELLAKLLYTLNAVPGSFVNVLAALPRSLVNVLSAIKDKKEAA